MTNKTSFRIAITCLVLFIIACFYLLKDRPAEPEKKVDEPSTVIDATPEMNGRKIIGLPVGETRPPKDLKMNNTISNNWQDQLEEDLKIQGGENLKEIKIQKEASLIWVQDDVGINVESVKIIVKSTSNEESKFRALVDSQNGKIIETWDRPIEDPTSPKNNFRLKLDPRNINQ